MNGRYQHYLSLKTTHPQKHTSELAAQMAISEAELFFCRLGQDVVQLRPDFTALLHGLSLVGEIKNITRNPYAIHKLVGRYDNLRLGQHGIVLNPRALDLRLFPAQWHCAFAVDEQTTQGLRRSIQIFDNQGSAVLSVFTTEHTDLNAWSELISECSLRKHRELDLRPYPVPLHSGAVNAQALEHEWRAMTDVHQFFSLLKNHEVSRQQAFRAVGADLACLVDNDAVQQILVQAEKAQNEIMIFVASRGCVQIFTGPVDKVTAANKQLHVANPAFSLQLNMHNIAETWVTRKPTREGFVTSLELFAADGTQIAQLYGQRSEGMPEQLIWREQIDAVMNTGVAA
ncbi:hemin transporter [Mangrovibacter phragmitis]|uniref:Hemin transporter n=1 Tax=Mangrovibacter phragmitis TaxID=1691903 RepID=A0A1B7L5Q2_9ENTR|nr:ChuX/HutX family heme-like substrate-binding protein [Mangrovibacter phragmitis]OAT77605.1 hemin transporter [Mangrovibacter phragmitis]